MGAKAFEQCAGFLRIPQAKNPLDNSAVHPESYPIVEQIAKDLSCTVDELIKSKELRSRIDIKKYVTPTVGLPTLTDIIQELDKPGRDPRQQIQVFEFDKNVKTIEDLTEGMELPGIVNNITNFGCFVDIGIKEKRSGARITTGRQICERPHHRSQHPSACTGESDEHRPRAQAHPAHYERIESIIATR